MLYFVQNMEKKPSKTITTRAAIAYYWRHAKQYPILMGGTVVFVTAAIAADSLSPWVIKHIFDLLEHSTPNTTTIALFVPALITLPAVKLAGWMFWRIFDLFVIPFQTKVRVHIEQDAFKRIFHNSQRFFADNFAGSIAKQIARASNGFEEFADQIQFNFIPAFIVVTGAIVGLALQFPLLALIFLGWIVFFLAVQAVTSHWAIQADNVRAELDSKVGGVLADALTNAQTIKTHASEAQEHKIFQNILNDHAAAQRRSWWRHSYAGALQGIMMIAIEATLIYLGVNAWIEGTLTLGDIAFIQAFAVLVFTRIWDLGKSMRRTAQSLVNAKEILETLLEPVEVQDKADASKLTIVGGSIAFNHISFGFNKRQSVLKDFSLFVNSGEKIALIGPSGAGKTTVTKLLFRFYNPKKGTILIDGQDIAKVTQASLRDQISLVPQDPVLFHRTIMDNIRYGDPDATDAQVIEASKRAHSHKFISKLQNGYETFVGERGIKLSGGERQRVAIARAILRNAPILVLDEATSALDSGSEHLIQEALAELMKNKTVIVIAHRLSTIRMMDRIVVIEGGQITDTGTHKELLSSGGTYNDLWELQAGAFGE